MRLMNLAGDAAIIAAAEPVFKVESSSDGISSLTLEGIVNSWNKGAERIYGYSAQQILGRPVHRVRVQPTLDMPGTA